ncbi:MAG: Rdx family protein [Desulfobacterales bacterium]|nr:Rdx family protein [Desulfobacterales bacterium]MBU8910852.1 Rdx family protein [Desulfobacterales bacterium]
MADIIKKEFGITPELIPGANGIYDIIVDKKTIFSKHQTKKFPDNDEIIKLIKK